LILFIEAKILKNVGVRFIEPAFPDLVKSGRVGLDLPAMRDARRGGRVNQPLRLINSFLGYKAQLKM